jgi:hypothetical protein
MLLLSMNSSNRLNFVHSALGITITSCLISKVHKGGYEVIWASNWRKIAIGLDPHQDSPCKILHSVLLGDDKYIWHETNSAWDSGKTKDTKFAVRLQSSSTDGLNMVSLCGRYIVKYKNALIGKHFKVLQQLGAFHLHDNLCGKTLFDLWKASGELSALLWFPEIRNREQYLVRL